MKVYVLLFALTKPFEVLVLLTSLDSYRLMNAKDLLLSSSMLCKESVTLERRKDLSGK